MKKLNTDKCVCQVPNSYRRGEEVTYFGSDLNKWIKLFCTKEMTHINLDGLSHKKSKKIVRIIESKHSKEGEKLEHGMPKGQWDVLCLLAGLFKRVNEMYDHTFECYVVRGDFPYEVVEVEDLVNDKEFTLDNGNLKNFLDFKDYQTIESLNEIHS